MAAIEDLIARHQPIELPPPRQRRAIREARGIPQKALGRAVGVSGVAICRYENGDRDPQGETRRRYAEALRELQRG